jgi:hypothetical protein
MSNYFRSNYPAGNFALSLGNNPQLSRTQASLFNSQESSVLVRGLTGAAGPGYGRVSVGNIGTSTVLNLSITGTSLTSSTQNLGLAAGTLATGFRPTSDIDIPVVVRNTTGPDGLTTLSKYPGLLVVGADGSLTVQPLPATVPFTGAGVGLNTSVSWVNGL